MLTKNVKRTLGLLRDNLLTKKFSKMNLCHLTNKLNIPNSYTRTNMSVYGKRNFSETSVQNCKKWFSINLLRIIFLFVHGLASYSILS